MTDPHGATPGPSPAPPGDVLPGFIETSVLLHTDDAKTVGLTAVAAYPQGFVFELWLIQPQAGGQRGSAVEPVSVGVRYADGRSVSVSVPDALRRPSPLPRPSQQAPPGLLARPTRASVVPSGAQHQIWVSPLPPRGPVELTLSTPEGQVLGSVVLQGADLLAAAARAVEVPSPEPAEPLFDVRHAPPLPPPGRPAELEAEAEIKRAFGEAFTAGRDGSAFIQDGEVLGGSMQAAAGAWPDVAATLQVGLGEVVFLDEVRAAVQYQLTWAAGGFGPQLGYAVREHDRWKVARGTYCRLLDAAGVEYPPPPPQ